jgi:glycosyltransferase involved in cell wall biosynthesis
LTAAGVEFLTLEMRKGLADPRGWIRFNRWLNRERPQVVHAHLPHAAWLARWSRLCVPVQVLVDTLHSSSTGTFARHFGYRASIWLPDQVTAVSESVARAHLLAGMVNPANLSVVPNGIDVEDFHPDPEVRAAARRELGLDDEFLWLAAGRLEPVKDYPTLLRAFSHVPAPARLLIAGAGSLQHKLCQFSAQLGLEHRVRFLGFQPDVKPWLCAADGFVLSSLWEGLPLGLLEAGACALPAIATDVPGSREAIVCGRTGRLVPSGSPTALARAMTAMMLVSPKDRHAMGNLARLHVSEHFSIDAMLDRWEQLYEQLLASSYQPDREMRRAITA